MAFSLASKLSTYIYLIFSGYILARNAQQTFCTRFKQILYWFRLWDKIDYCRPNDTIYAHKYPSIDNFYWRRLNHTYCVYSDHWCDANHCNLHPFICCIMCSFCGSWINASLFSPRNDVFVTDENSLMFHKYTEAGSFHWLCLCDRMCTLGS